MVPPVAPVRSISARMIGNDARHATEEAREHHPLVWDRTLVFLILAWSAALALSLVLFWVFFHF